MGHVMSIKTRLPFSFSDTKSSFTLSNLLLSIPECFVRVPENFSALEVWSLDFQSSKHFLVELLGISYKTFVLFI